MLHIFSKINIFLTDPDKHGHKRCITMYYVSLQTNQKIFVECSIYSTVNWPQRI